jgi:hypothetical protein
MWELPGQKKFPSCLPGAMGNRKILPLSEFAEKFLVGSVLSAASVRCSMHASTSCSQIEITCRETYTAKIVSANSFSFFCDRYHVVLFLKDVNAIWKIVGGCSVFLSY